MADPLSSSKVKENAVELAFAARSFFQQLSLKGRNPERIRAGEILEQALSRAIAELDQTANNQAFPA